jgi:hypothetical protein
VIIATLRWSLKAGGKDRRRYKSRFQPRGRACVAEVEKTGQPELRDFFVA